MAKFFQIVCTNCGEKFFLGKYKGREGLKKETNKKLLEDATNFENSHKGHQLKIIEYRMK